MWYGLVVGMLSILLPATRYRMWRPVAVPCRRGLPAASVAASRANQAKITDAKSRGLLGITTVSWTPASGGKPDGKTYGFGHRF